MHNIIIINCDYASFLNINIELLVKRNTENTSDKRGDFLYKQGVDGDALMSLPHFLSSEVTEITLSNVTSINNI